MATPPKPTVKQLREQKRQEQIAKFRQQEAARKRNRVLAIVGGAVALVLVAGGVTAAILLNGPQPVDESQVSGDYLDRLQTFDELQGVHVETAVTYDQTPPAGGPHNPAWLNCGVYEQQQRSEYAVHSLEHGAIWVTYDPGFTTDDEIAALVDLVPDTYSIVSPFEGIGEAMAISAWGAQLRFTDVDDPAVQDFIDQFWRAATSPEPNAPCTGAFTGPGLVS